MSRLETAGVPLDKRRIASLREASLIATNRHNLAVTQTGRLLSGGLLTRCWQLKGWMDMD